MRILSKIATALRGAASEAGESVVDANQMRILDQEIRDADKSLGQAKENLTKVMAERRAVEREIVRLTAQIEEHEGYAVAAVENGNDSLAEDVCTKIAEFQDDLEANRAAAQELDSGLKALRHDVRETERNLNSMKRQVNMVKANEKVQRASALTAAQHSGTQSAMRSATDSLARVRQRQQEQADRTAAARQLHEESEGTDLKKRLAEAGIGARESATSDVMARIKARAKSGS